MSDWYVPEFMKIDIDAAEKIPLYDMMGEYQEKFGRSFCTETRIMTDAEMIEAMKECIRTGVEMEKSPLTC